MQDRSNTKKTIPLALWEIGVTQKNNSPRPVGEGLGVRDQNIVNHNKIMEIKINSIENGHIVIIEGEIDSSSAPEVTETIIPLATEKSKIILDMTKVEYMSSAGLRTLLSIHRQTVAKEAKLTLVGLSEDIKDTMSVTGFLNFFTVSDTLDIAKTQI